MCEVIFSLGNMHLVWKELEDNHYEKLDPRIVQCKGKGVWCQLLEEVTGHGFLSVKQPGRFLAFNVAKNEHWTILFISFIVISLWLDHLSN